MRVDLYYWDNTVLFEIGTGIRKIFIKKIIHCLKICLAKIYIANFTIFFTYIIILMLTKKNRRAISFSS